LPAGANPADERSLLLTVANRPQDSGTTYTTGGEVSRFQRSSVPARATQAPAGGAGGAVAAAPAGPVVRVARGNAVTEVPVGAR
jgi:pilus assembly protein CpaB